MSCVQLHHPSQLMKPWSKVNVKRVNELWCPQHSPRPISLYGLSDGRTHVQTDGRTYFRYYQVPLAMPWDNNILILVIYQ